MRAGDRWRDSEGEVNETQVHRCGPSCSGNRHVSPVYGHLPISRDDAIQACQLNDLIFIDFMEAPDLYPIDPIHKVAWRYRYLLTTEDPSE